MCEEAILAAAGLPQNTINHVHKKLPRQCRHPCVADGLAAARRYSALKSLGEKKACFNEYVQQRKNEEVVEKRQRLKRAREDFTAMLEGTHDLRASTRYSAAAALLEDDPRWKVSPGLELWLTLSILCSASCCCLICTVHLVG